MKEETDKKSQEVTKITPLKDWLIVQNEHRIEIKKGVELEIPNKFLETLVTEKVINEKGGKNVRRKD